ncbi:nucleotidyl transferase [Halobiforma lacisalsi AJ5]|uniref:Bifunctional protein GlmU n=1 Tax=Natronobacterium lacisalsi AJ5 TaxID=358396 RepID=M0LGY1_NATLA|nr:sugar phosphate nucleotidyltransferase [Halobiforma lacisalsi]EMA32343.1 nucleotidyl transferase [Halobiforma lacisalsi AJ5]
MAIETAVVLAAGEGTRLRPLTRNRPKPMLPAATKPILEHVFDQLLEAGIERLVVVVGYGRTRVQSHFGPTYRNAPITYVTQESQLGTGHALLTAESAVDGSLLAINGDQIADESIVRDVLEAHGDGGKATPNDGPAATLALLRRPADSQYGGAYVDDGRVTELEESPGDDRSYHLNAGIYACEPAVFDAVREATSETGEHSLIDGLSRLVSSDALVRGVVTEGTWVDATYPWDLLDVSFALCDAGMLEADPPAGDRSAATIHDRAVVREPAVIDRDCVIGPGAVVGPYVCLGENATVGSNAVLERSVVDADTTVADNATVVDCVTGTGVTIGAGSTVPGGPGDVRVGDRVFEDESLGALLADRVTDHGGVAYVPGTIVGPDTELRTGATVRGTVPERTEVWP